MGRSIRGWGRLLVGLMPVGLLLVACTGAAGLSGEAGVAAPQAEPAAVVGLHEHDAVPSPESAGDLTQERVTKLAQIQDALPSDEPVGYLTINVDVTDDGIQPASIFIPAGQRVQLVLRNRGTTEHHYRVVGLVPGGVLWLAREATAAEAALVTDGMVPEDEHAAHHQGAGFVPYRSPSPAGIQPAGNEVHAYAAGGDMDVVLFTAMNTGTFVVQCPLHPEIVGKVTVF